MASVNLSQAPPQLRQGSANYPQPVALLARLGVDTRHEGRGLGAALLADVLARLVRIAVDIGCRGLLIHSETYEARDFYVHNVPELESSPTAELHLYLLMKHARRAVAATKAR